MRQIWLIALLLWSSSGLAQTAEPGSVIAVFGTLQECNEWTGRVLDVEEVSADGAIELLGFEINVLDLDDKAITEQLEEGIKSKTGRTPTSLYVRVQSIMTSDLVARYSMSLKHTIHETCAQAPQKPVTPGMKDMYRGDVPDAMELDLMDIVIKPPFDLRYNREQYLPMIKIALDIEWAIPPLCEEWCKPIV